MIDNAELLYKIPAGNPRQIITVSTEKAFVHSNHALHFTYPLDWDCKVGPKLAALRWFPQVLGPLCSLYTFDHPLIIP